MTASVTSVPLRAALAQPRPMPSSSARSSGPSRIFSLLRSGAQRRSSCSIIAPPTHGRTNLASSSSRVRLKTRVDVGELAQLEVVHVRAPYDPDCARCRSWASVMRPSADSRPSHPIGSEWRSTSRSL